MQNMRRTFYWTILASELSHIFCCVLPVLLSLISIFSLYGAMNAVPGFIWSAHDFMHHWEPVILVVSALLLLSGWGLWAQQKQVSHPTHSCQTSNCDEAKSLRKMRLMLLVTSGLFAVNFSVYALIHAEHAPFSQENHMSDAAHNHDHSQLH